VGGTFLVVAVLLILFWIAAWLWAVTKSQDAWDRIGKGGAFGIDSDADRLARETPAEREADLEALRVARDARRRTRGEQDLPPPTEGPAAARSAPPDPELEAEVRAVVRARNERRARAGKAPLDVEAEVARILAAQP